MVRNYLMAAMMLVALVGCNGQAESGEARTGTETTEENVVTGDDFRNIPFETIDGDSTSLAAFSGKVLLIVNVASKCGNTPQYAGLEELYEKYQDSGLVVIGFPANNFGGQEPGSNEEIMTFCTTNFGVTFPMMAKLSVKGNDKHPLFVELTEKSDLPGEIGWNFSKFLVDREGRLVARFDPKVQPMSDEVISAIQGLL